MCDMAQKHLRWTMEAPCSSKSLLVIHIVWKVVSEARMEPPIQTENLRSLGSMVVIFIEEGARKLTSLDSLSLMPGNIVDPPLITTFE